MIRLLPLLIWSLLLPLAASEDLTGTVRDPEGRAIPGIIVTNGRDAVRTGGKGEFNLPAHPATRFVSLVEPANGQANSWYLAIKPETATYDFVLTRREVPEKFRFIQFSDAECWSAGRWFEDLKALAAAEKPAFAVNTGDICYRKGLQFQIANVNRDTLGIPVHYTLGNHDLIKPEANEYGGEALYESLYGPAWRAFECGNVLFLALPVVAGDAKPSFSRDDLAAWLRNLLAHYPAEKPIIILTHHPLLFGSDWKVGDFELGKRNLKGIFYGHFHVHDFRMYGKVPGFATSAVRVGGASSAPAAFRLTEVDRDGNCRSELRWTYAGEVLSITTPAGDDRLAIDRVRNELPVLAAVNGPAAPVRVEAALTGPDGKTEAIKLERRTAWSWTGAFPLPVKPGQYRLKLRAEFKDGSQKETASCFNWPPPERKIAPGPDTVQYLGDARRTGFAAPVGNRARLAWASALDGHIFVSSPVLAGKRLLIGTVDDAMGEKGGVHALDAETGKLLWSFRTAGSVRHSVAVDKGLVLAVDSRNRVYAIDAASGELRWEAPGIGDALSGNSTGVLAADGRVFAGRDQGLRAFDAASGKELWRISRDEIPNYRPDAGTVNAFALAGDVLIAPANWIHLRAFDAATGKLRWVNADHRYLQNAGSIGPDGKLYVAAGRLLVIDPADGKVLKMSEKTEKLSFNTGSTPQLREQLILVGSAEKGMTALDRDTLAVRWTTPDVGSGLVASAPYRPNSPAVAATAVTAAATVWFGALDGNLYGVDLATGAMRQKFIIGAPVFSSATISGNMLYVADFAGRVYGFVLE